MDSLGFRYPLPLLLSMVAVESPSGTAEYVGLAEFESLSRRLCELESLGLHPGPS